MIKKPITLHIKLTYTQAIVLLHQLESQLDKANNNADPREELRAFQKYKKSLETN